MNITNLKYELHLAKEGLEQIGLEQEAGGYEDYCHFLRDVRNQEQQIEKLERKIALAEIEVAFT